ncbi:MAG: hypothetical protein ACQESY_01675 [Pseudomonadota bacterium]
MHEDNNIEQRGQQIQRLRDKLEVLRQQQEHVPDHLRHDYSNELQRLQDMLLQAEQRQHEELAKRQPGLVARQQDYEEMDNALDSALARFGPPD